MKKKILIYNSGGGLGDSIQLFSLILSLKNNFNNYDLYYLGAHPNHFIDSLKDYKIKVKNLDLNLKYFGFRWWHYFVTKNKYKNIDNKEYDLIIDLQSKLRNTLILKKIPNLNFYSSTFNFYFCSIKKNFSFKRNLTDMTLQNLNTFLNLNIKKTSYDAEVIPELYKKEAKRLLPNNSYIGFSITQGNLYRKKTWPLENFIKLANLIVIKNKVPVFFIEKKNINLINKIKAEVPNAIFPELKSQISSPPLVTCLAKRLDKAISIDNGVMHMIGLANIPMIILFGPTDAKKFAPEGKNIKIIDSKEIYKSNDISKIGVEDVIKYI